MRDLLPIHQAIELIEARLRADVSVSEMAAVAGYSLYHFIRTFDQVVYHTPYNYLMRRRLSEAAHELVYSNRRVIDIAVEYRFGNHETFSRAFKRLFGIQPTQWREQGVIPHQRLMPALSLAYLEHIHQQGFQNPEISKAVPRYVAGLMAPITGQTDKVERLWRSLERALEILPPMEAPANFWGIISYLEGLPEECFYLAALEISSPDMVLPHLTYQTLPTGSYVRIAHRGSTETLPLTLAYLYHTWLPKAGLQPAYPVEIIAFGETPPWVTTGSGEKTILLPVK